MKRSLTLFVLLMLATSFAAWAGTDNPGWIGITLTPTEGGISVIKVCDGSPAQDGGLKAGDIITKINGRRFGGSDEFVHLMKETEAGTSVKLVLKRNGDKTEVITIVVGERPQSAHECLTNWLPEIIHPGNLSHFIHPVKTRTAYMGVHLQEMTEDLREYFGVPRENGVLISEVETGSPAGRAGLKAGDVIVQMDGANITCGADITTSIHNRKAGDGMPILVYRKGKSRNVVVTLEEREKARYDLKFLMQGKHDCKPGNKDANCFIWHWDDKEFEGSLKKVEKYFQSDDFKNTIHSQEKLQIIMEEKMKLLEQKLKKLEKALADDREPSS